MLITKAKHERIVSLKDADIKVKDNKIKSLSKSRYKDLEEIDNLKEEIKLLKLELSMNKDYVSNLKDCLEESDLQIKEIYDDLLKYKREVARMEEVKRQYKDKIRRALEITHIEHYASTKDVELFMSKEGAKGVIDLYMLASLM